MATARSRVTTPADAIEEVLTELLAIRKDMLESTVLAAPMIQEVHPRFLESARNLLHYLALRRRDLRHLQQRLAVIGPASLGQSESHVLATLDALLMILNRMKDKSWMPPAHELPPIGFTRGQELLREHTEDLLGGNTHGRSVRIMVTMPSEAAHDYTLVHSLLEQGMDCMRINCAHDDAGAWLKMIENLRRAEKAMKRKCRVVMDLAGPKLRTGPLEPGAVVARIRPHRDDYGRQTAPARLWLTAAESPETPPSPADAVLPVARAWLSGLVRSDVIHFFDARQSPREFRVVDVTERGCWAEIHKSAYIIPGTELKADRSRVGKTKVFPFSAKENFIFLNLGDHLIVTRDQQAGRQATFDSAGDILTPAVIGCTIPEVFEDVRSGESIWFDDGKIGGVVEKVESGRVFVRITQARLRGEKLRGDKGINLPESNLRLAAMTDKDIEDLSFVVEHADIVELSFANTVRDVIMLQEHLARLGKKQPAIVLKIETRRAFDNLPEMVLMAMRAPCCGVMIARGDLAVECGFERLAEVQEEILWICEAAHVPVIWATQVLETLAKEGQPSRAEITDAAMGQRAECVMLNKGPHVISAVRVLDDILRRMQAHQTKKRDILRELHLAHGLLSASRPGTSGKGVNKKPAVG